MGHVRPFSTANYQDYQGGSHGKHPTASEARLALGSVAVGFRARGARHTGHLVWCWHRASILLAGSRLDEA